MVGAMRGKSDSELEELQVKHQARLDGIAELRAKIARERSLLETERQQLRLDEERTMMAMAFHTGSHEINGDFRNLFFHLGRLKRMLGKHEGATREVNAATDSARRLRQKNDHLWALIPGSMRKNTEGSWVADWLLADHHHSIRVTGSEVVIDDSFRDLTFCVNRRSLLVLLSLLMDNALYWTMKWRYGSDEEVAGREAPYKARIVITARVESETHTTSDPEVIEAMGRDSWEERWAVVRIEDNGTGVPEGFRDLIFLPYTQDRSRSDSHGIGLYLARRCAQRLSCSKDGTLELVDSDSGAAFEFRVPIAKEK